MDVSNFSWEGRRRRLVRPRPEEPIRIGPLIISPEGKARLRFDPADGPVKFEKLEGLTYAAQKYLEDGENRLVVLAYRRKSCLSFYMSDREEFFIIEKRRKLGWIYVMGA